MNSLGKIAFQDSRGWNFNNSIDEEFHTTLFQPLLVNKIVKLTTTTVLKDDFVKIFHVWMSSSFISAQVELVRKHLSEPL